MAGTIRCTCVPSVRYSSTPTWTKPSCTRYPVPTATVAHNPKAILARIMFARLLSLPGLCARALRIKPDVHGVVPVLYADQLRVAASCQRANRANQIELVVSRGEQRVHDGQGHAYFDVLLVLALMPVDSMHQK